MKKNITALYAITQFSYWVGAAVIAAFASFYLLSMGISNSMVGLVIAAGGIMAAIMQPWFGGLSDRYAIFSSNNLLIVMGILEGICAIALMMLGKNHTVLICLVYGTAVFLQQLMQPFVNTIAVVYENAGYPLNYGFARTFGSIGYALCAFLMGNLAARFGTITVPTGIIFGFGLMFAGVLFYPRMGENRQAGGMEKSTGDGNVNSGKGFLKRYPSFAILLIGLILIFYSHGLMNTYTLQIITTKGGGSAEMGTATALAAVAEMFLFFFSAQIMKRVDLGLLLRISAVFFMLKNLASLLVHTVTQYYLAMSLQVFAWGIIAVVLVYYVNEIMESGDTVKGQAYATMTITVGNFLAASLGGILIDALGVSAMMISGIIATLAAIVIVCIATKK